jgi:hypothetical protein
MYVCVCVCVVRSVGKHTFLKLEVLAVVDIKHIEECSVCVRVASRCAVSRGNLAQ